MGVQRLGVSTPSTNTDTLIYTADYPFLASVIGTNLTTSTSLVDVWVVPTGVTQTSGYVYYAYQTDIPPSNTLETHKFALNIGDRVYVRSTQNTSFNLAGLRQVDIQLATGVTSFQTTAPTNPINGQVWVDGDGVAGTNISSLAGYNVQASSATQVPFQIQAASGQTADLQQWDHVNGTPLARVDSTGLVYSQQSPVINANGLYAAGKNKVINGAFDIWQRATSTLHGANIFVTDRWRGDQGAGGGDYTTSRQAVSTGEPFNYCARITRTTTTTTPSYFYTALESLDSSVAKGNYVTLSFYARKGSGFSGLLVAHLYSGTGTDQGTPHGFTNLVDNGANINLTTSFQRFTVTTSSALSTATNQLGVTFNTVNQTGTPTNDYVEITGVQLEIGQSATSFSRAAGTIQGELAACQRYYVRFGGDHVDQVFAHGFGANSTACYLLASLPVSMRIPSTTLEYSTLAVNDFAGSASTFSSIGISQQSKDRPMLIIQGATGITQYRTYFLKANNSLSSYLAFSSEL